MDTLITLRRPIRDVKPRKSKSVKSKKVNCVKKKSKQIEQSQAPPPTEFGSFVALYREARDHDSAEPLRASGSTSSTPPLPQRGGGDARRPLVHVVMEIEY